MSSKNLYQKKNEKFLKYWETKRVDKKKYAIKNAVIFSFTFSLIYTLIIEGFSYEFLTSFPLNFLIYSILFGLYVYFIEYNVLEKRYQKLKKERQDFDH